MATEDNKVLDYETESARPMCGIVMPISAIEDLSELHWAEILALLKEIANSAGYDSELVSASTFSGIIHNRIIGNLYANEIVVCDVSAKNPNVMFELGMRLTFDKPTIVIVDDQTKISFDTSPLKHLIYPRDLRHGKILAFKEELRLAIISTVQEFQNPNHKSFLKNFGTFDVKSLKQNDSDYNQFVIDKLEMLTSEIASLRETNRNSHFVNTTRTGGDLRRYVIRGIEVMMGDLALSLEDLMRNNDLRIKIIENTVDYLQSKSGGKVSRAYVHSILDDLIANKSIKP